MRKVISVVLVVMMVLTMSVSAFATTDSFVKSPSVNPAPDLEKIENPEGCDAVVVITPYVEREELDEESKSTIEDAYDTIKNNEDGSSLDKALEELATEEKPADTLAISDLFDVDYTDCDIHEEHDPITITISAETVDHYAGLLVYVDGVWKIVKDATVNKEETTLTFRAAEFGPYAIVVDSTFGGTPDTGDAGIPWFWFVLLGVSGVGLIAVAVASKKRVEE